MKKGIFGFLIIAILIIGSTTLITACNDDDKTPAVVDVAITLNDSVVTSILNRMPGSTTQFGVVVNVKDGAKKTVNWKVDGGVTGTTINSEGLLSIAANEIANAELVVTATSAVDSKKSASVTVKVLDPSAPMVDGVIISTFQNRTRVARGGTLIFYADVNALNGASDEVEWSITSTGHNAGTVLEEVYTTGYETRLLVHEDESAASITIKATPKQKDFESEAKTHTVEIYTPIETDALFTIYSDGYHAMEFFEWNNEGAAPTTGMITTAADGKGRNGGLAIEINLELIAGNYPWWGIEFSTLDSAIEPVDRSEVDALSLWIRSEGGDAVIGEISFGDGNDRLVISNVPVTGDWENVIIPVPVKKAGTITQLFTMGGGDVGGKRVYIDDIELVRLNVALDEIILLNEFPLTIDPPPAVTNGNDLLHGAKIKLLYGPDNTAFFYTHGADAYLTAWYNITYNIASGATVSGYTITPAAANTSFELGLSFGGKSSTSTMTVNVSGRYAILITDFSWVPNPVGSAWPGGQIAGWGLPGNLGEPNIIVGHDGGKALVWHGDGNSGFVRANSIPDVINIEENNIITFYVFAVGSALGQPAVLMLRHSGAANDAGFNATNSHHLNFTVSTTAGWNSYSVTIPTLNSATRMIRGVGVNLPSKALPHGTGNPFSIGIGTVTAR